jgi:integrase
MASVAKREWTNPKGEKKFGFEVRYKEGGKHRSRTFKLFKQADAYRKKVERELVDGNHVADADTVTVAKACDQFLDHCEERMREGQIGRGRFESIRSAIKVYVRPSLGHIKLKELAFNDLEKLRQLAKSRGVSPFSMRRYVVVAVMVEDFAIRRGYASKPVIATYRKDLGSVSVKPIPTFTTEEVVRLIQYVDTDRKHSKRRSAALLRCFVHLGAFCTLRWGEIAGLTLDCLDLETRHLKIRHSITPFDEHKGPKTPAGNRDVPLPQHVVPILQAWIREYYVENPRRLLFRKSDGEQLTPCNFRNAHWYPALYRTGLSDPGQREKRHFHALRHFAASLMANSYLPLMEVATLMGHARFDTTLQTYVHSIVGGQRKNDAFDLVASQTLALAYAPVTHEHVSP